MLIDYLVGFCDQKYSSIEDKCGCETGNCNHPSGTCSGSCYNCLYQIHYPERTDGIAKTLYDCPKMLYHYVCQYSVLYSTELICAFGTEWELITKYPYLHVLSLGCGGCADLMAIDYLRQKYKYNSPISYIGIDINKLWKPIHAKIGEYCINNGIKFKTRYYDVFECFKRNSLSDTNVIVISYLISYLYNTGQISMISALVRDIVNNVVKKKGDNQSLVLIVNDVNSYKRGRDYFFYFEDAINKSKLTVVKSEYRYFDNGKLVNGQKIGAPYKTKKTIIDIPRGIRDKYHAQSTIKATSQLLLEVM